MRWLCSELQSAPIKPNRFALWLDGLHFDSLATPEEQLSYLRFMESRLRQGGVAVIATTTNIEQLISTNPEFTLELEEVDPSTYQQIGLIQEASASHKLWALKQPTVIV